MPTGERKDAPACAVACLSRSSLICRTGGNIGHGQGKAGRWIGIRIRAGERCAGGRSVACAGRYLEPSLNESSGTVAHDTVFNHDPGTVQSGATSTQGRFQGSLAFDGNNGAVDVPNEPALEPANVTVSAWVNSATRPGNFRYVVVKGATGCIAGSYGMYTGANGGLEFYASSNGGL